jgi:hypothetical protein
MLRRKAESLAVTIRVAMTTEATITVARTTAASEVRKIAAAHRAALSLVDQHSAALTTARLKPPVPPHPARPRKNPFFSQASL